ncbi:MAG TPA: hypothetical protein VFZ59_10495 [Verrucomicrobiae bacterium]|nr:hypothetical protein [Verrucomicrobiae bacterium]
MRSAFVIILLVASLHPLRGEMDSLPPDRASILGEWIGFAYQGTEFYRLELRSDRRDILIRMHPDDSCEAYSITSWNVKPGKLSLLNERDNRAEPIEVNCSAVERRYIKLEIRGVGKQWSRSVTLYKNDEVSTGLKATRKAAKKALRANGRK